MVRGYGAHIEPERSEDHMKKRILYTLAAASLLFAPACSRGETSTSVEDSPSAVPGMNESVEPTLGTGVTEEPS